MERGRNVEELIDRTMTRTLALAGAEYRRQKILEITVARRPVPQRPEDVTAGQICVNPTGRSGQAIGSALHEENEDRKDKEHHELLEWHTAGGG